MLITHQNPFNKSLSIVVLGRPNVGKSTFINAMMGDHLSIVSSKAQTTRNSFRCITQIDQTELIFTDTPGVHESAFEINKRMNYQAKESTRGGDLSLILIDGTSLDFKKEYENVLMQLENEVSECWVVITKNDVKPSSKEKVSDLLAAHPEIEKIFSISATSGEGMEVLTGAFLERAPSAPHYYPNGEISNKPTRFFAAEYVREQAFIILKKEVPYELAVIIDDFKTEKNEFGKLRSQVFTTILVNRPSQRAIVIGSKGKNIDIIRINAKSKLEKLMRHPVKLHVHVKIAPKWFKKNFILEQLDLPRAPESARVWKKTKEKSERTQL